jgi:hypothetical protein
MNRKNSRRKKKFRSSATAETLSAFKTLVDWCVLCVCVCCRRRRRRRRRHHHRRPKDIGWSKEKKGEKTETDIQSKAIEGVPRHAHAFSCSWYFFLYLSSLVLVESSIFPSCSSRSTHVDLIYTDYFIIAIDHPRGWK